MKKLALSLMLTFVGSFLANAQSSIEMADAFRADGKIYVVIAVFSVLLVGFFAYLFAVDRKISKMENELKDTAGNEPSAKHNS